MGYIKDEAIIVTGSVEECNIARKEAVELGLVSTPVMKHKTNGAASFLIVPDGSKEGWDASDDGDGQRGAWKKWARDNRGKLKLAGGFTFWPRWVHVSYDDDGECHVVESWDANEP